MKRPPTLPDISYLPTTSPAELLAVADKIAAFYQRLEGGRHAGLRTFLQYAYCLGVAFAQDELAFSKAPGFRILAGAGTKADAEKRHACDALLRHARRLRTRSRPRWKYAKILTLFHQQSVPPTEVAQLIDDLGGVERILRLLSGREKPGFEPSLEEGEGSAAGGPDRLANNDRNDDASMRATGWRDKCLAYVAEQSSRRARACGQANPPKLEDNIHLSEGLFVKMPENRLNAALRLADGIRLPLLATIDVVIYPRDADGWVAVSGDKVVVSRASLTAASEPDDDDEFDFCGPKLMDQTPSRSSNRPKRADRRPMPSGDPRPRRYIEVWRAAARNEKIFGPIAHSLKRRRFGFGNPAAEKGRCC